MVNAMLIQSQPITPRDRAQGYTAKFDNMQEAMGYLKAVDTMETALALDPHVQVASFGPLDGTPAGTVLGNVSAQVLAEQGFDTAVNNTGSRGVEWALSGRAGSVSFSDDARGMSATVADGRGVRHAAISPQQNGILYMEF